MRLMMRTEVISLCSGMPVYGFFCFFFPLGREQFECNFKSRTFSAFALQKFNRSIHLIGKAPSDSQSQARSTELTGGGHISLSEWFKQARRLSSC